MIKFGWMGAGDYWVADDDQFLGRVSMTGTPKQRRKGKGWEAWKGHEGINTGKFFATRIEAANYLKETRCS